MIREFLNWPGERSARKVSQRAALNDAYLASQEKPPAICSRFVHEKDENMNKRILVVDDDPGLRFILQELFEGEAYEVDTASDGIIALEKICSICGTYDAILLDMTMPRMNGLQMLQELYQQAWVGFPSIIVLSADEMALQQAAGMGVGHVLSKPFEVAALLALVAAVSSFSVMEHVC